LFFSGCGELQAMLVLRAAELPLFSTDQVWQARASLDLLHDRACLRGFQFWL
jgi:hypothetical protein